MHGSVMAWVGATLTQADVGGRAVLEVGSYDVNGTVRPLVERLGPASYVGVDQVAGPNVDRVADAADLVSVFGADAFDVVVSTELLEHAEDWRGCLLGMVGALRPGGLLVVTTRGPGFPYHPFPGDHWRFTVDAMADALAAAGLAERMVWPDPDPGSPGVFARAVKDDPWRPDRVALAAVVAGPAPPRS